jgi:uncharacterized protein YqeY
MAKGEIASKVQQATIAAMKARSKERLGVLRMLQAAIKQAEVDGRTELDDDGVIKALTSYARKVKDQLASARDSNRSDLLAQAEAELAIVQEFLPAELPEAELLELIQQTMAEVGASGPQDMGKLMKAVMAKVAGRAEGKLVSALVKQQLQS